MTPPTTRADILQLIADQVPESTNLEYKSRFPEDKPGKKWQGEFVKDVSAMANARGGVIIYGVSASNNEQSLPIEPTPIPKGTKSEDQLIQILSDNIQPVIPDIDIRYIPNSEKDGFFVITVPNSRTFHLNTITGQYRIRRNATTAIMTADEITDIVLSNLIPDVDIDFSLVALQYQNKERQWTEYQLEYALQNNGHRKAETIHYSLHLPAPITQLGTRTPQGDYHLIEGKNDRGELLPGEKEKLQTISLNGRTYQEILSLPPIQYKVRADSAPEKEITLQWADINIKEQKGDNIYSYSFVN